MEIIKLVVQLQINCKKHDQTSNLLIFMLMFVPDLKNVKPFAE